MSFVTLARNLNLDLIAEGLEMSDQLSLLKAIECQYGQEFLFSHPAGVEVLETRMGGRFTAMP